MANISSTLLSAASGNNVSASSLISPLPTAMGTLQYKDPNLTGCYAGTGGSTTFTLTSGDQLGLPSVASSINVGDHPQTFSMSCSEFFDLSLIPWDLKMSFAESPVCATYAQEPFALQPPGFANGDAHEPFDCCDGFQLMAPQAQNPILVYTFIYRMYTGQRDDQYRSAWISWGSGFACPGPVRRPEYCRC